MNFSRKSVQRRPDLIFVAVLVVFAGCDSSSSEDSSSATDTATSGGVSLSKAEFIAKADALCEASKAKQAPLRKRVEAVARKAGKRKRPVAGMSRTTPAGSWPKRWGNRRDGGSRPFEGPGPRASAGRRRSTRFDLPEDRIGIRIEPRLRLGSGRPRRREGSGTRRKRQCRDERNGSAREAVRI